MGDNRGGSKSIPLWLKRRVDYGSSEPLKKHLKAMTTPMKASMALSLFPSPCRPHLDVPDGGPEQTNHRELYFGVWNGAQNQGRGDVVATSSGLQKPKKVWAKKRFIHTKADKARKRASSKFKKH